MIRFLPLALLLCACGGGPDPAPAGPLEGTVTGVSARDGLCFLDIGRRDGVRVGQLFAVIRDGEEIGLLSADAIEEDWCACRERVEERRKELQKGDRVRAR